MTLNWRSWLGLPHEIGADPRDGQAACCLVIARLVLEDASYEVPEIDDMISQARSGQWLPLVNKFYELCEPVPTPEPNSITLLRNGVNGLGIGTVVEPNIMLTLHHKRGVIALPINRLRLLKFYRIKQ